MTHPDIPRQFHCIVLAAQRTGQINPLAKAAGVSHKCMMPLADKPLIIHVLSALDQAPEINNITIIIDDTDLLLGLPMVQSLITRNKLHIVKSGSTLFDSIVGGLNASKEAYPALITTADNVLLTPEMIAYFCENTMSSRADMTLGMVRQDVLLAKYPDGQRRFHRFKDGNWSNCNLYAFTNAQAAASAAAFKGGGQFAKSWMRVLKAFGLVNAIAYKYAWFTRDKAISRLGQCFNLSAVAVDMPFAEAPIDVDNERTKRIAGEILTARKQSSIQSKTNQNYKIETEG